MDENIIYTVKELTEKIVRQDCQVDLFTYVITDQALNMI